jgi:predicted metal-dependent HD superfamily phosphohydrolase
MFDFAQRWTKDWARLGLAGDAACLNRLLVSHAGPGRHYHTLQHLSECLTLFADVAHLAERPGEASGSTTQYPFRARRTTKRAAPPGQPRR